MIVRCPNCKTAYRIADEVLKETNPIFRCSRCKHTFEIEPPVPEQPVDKAHHSDKTLAKPDAEAEFSFTFPSNEREEFDSPSKFADSPKREHETPGTTTEMGAIESAESNPAQPLAPHRRQDNGREKQSMEPTDKTATEPSPSQPLPLPREATDNILSLDPYRDQSVSILPYLTLFGLLLISFAFMTALHRVHPEASERMIKAIPLIGTSVLKDNHLKTGVALQSLQASYQSIQGNREVFVVTGVAHNRNPVVIREVRIAGQLYGLEGKEVEQQTIWIGNAISPRIIRGMTAQDISDLQRLKPLKSFEMPPGDSIPFTIVFLKSTKEIKDFSCSVVAVEGQA
ncbi:MAG: zinc-ribbon domain-containing protein [Candidatus Binatia bacterium]